MKRFVCLLLCCLMLALPALGEKTVSVRVVGHQALDDNAYYDLDILRIDVNDDGRAIPPVYALTESAFAYGESGGYQLADVNFDGCDDLALITILGASNACYTFYLWDEAQGAFVWYGGKDLWNYELLPERGQVISRGVSGMAGLLHEVTVYQWSEDGKELQPLRTVTWDTLHTTAYEDREGGFAVVELYDDSTLVETYHDYRSGEHTELQFPLAAYEDEAFMRQRFDYEAAYLAVE